MAQPTMDAAEELFLTAQADRIVSAINANTAAINMASTIAANAAASAATSSN